MARAVLRVCDPEDVVEIDVGSTIVTRLCGHVLHVHGDFKVLDERPVVQRGGIWDLKYSVVSGHRVGTQAQEGVAVEEVLCSLVDAFGEDEDPGVSCCETEADDHVQEFEG